MDNTSHVYKLYLMDNYMFMTYNSPWFPWLNWMFFHAPNTFRCRRNKEPLSPLSGAGAALPRGPGRCPCTAGAQKTSGALRWCQKSGGIHGEKPWWKAKKSWENGANYGEILASPWVFTMVLPWLKPWGKNPSKNMGNIHLTWWRR